MNLYKSTCSLLLMGLAISCSEAGEIDLKSDVNVSTESFIAQDRLKDASIEVDVDEYPKYKIVSIDSTTGWLQRIFVVIDSVELEYINNHICDIRNKFKFDDKTNISFFSEEKYAGYQDDLFYGDGALDKSEYKNWLDTYYLAEFENKESIVTFYPVSTKFKRVSYNISCE